MTQKVRVKAFTYSELGRWCKIVPINTDYFSDTKEEMYNLIPARLLGISYPDYLNLLKELFPDKVKLRKEEFPVPYWLKGKEMFTFIDLLNKRWTLMTLNDKEKADEDTIHRD